MSRHIRGMTLFEAIVVVVVIVLLIAIMMPSLSGRGGSSPTVRCASNLKQLYTGMMLYAAQNDDAVIPAILNNGNSPNNRWYGSSTLGPMFGTITGGGGESQIAAMEQAQINKMLDCPSVNHPKGWGPIDQGGNGKWGFDYTYNQMLGSNSAAPAAPYDPLYPFVKRSDVRREVLVATDVRDVSNVHDYVFNGVTPSLVPTSTTNTTDYQAIAGTPHKSGTQTNMLFADGQIITDNINKLLGPPPKTWMVSWSALKTDDFPF